MGRILLEDSFVNNGDDSSERLKKEQEYLDYIKEHIEFVKKAYVIYFVPLLDKTCISNMISDSELKDAIEKLSLTIETHDASKFSDAEFDGYRAKYYPTQKEASDPEMQEALADRYERCWVHHYTTNWHHPEYWYNQETKTAKDMPLIAIVEMICDWEAMGMKFNNIALSWWEKDPEGKAEKEKIMTSKSIQIAEELMYNVIHK